MSDSKIKFESMDIDSIDYESEILQFIQKYPAGVSHKIVNDSFPNLTAERCVQIINRLIKSKTIDLLNSKNEPGTFFYRLSSNNKTSINSKTGTMDQMEIIVYQLIQETRNSGIGLRDLRIKTHLTPILLNKTLKIMETKKLIKGIKSIHENKRKVYMLYELTPDSKVTGGPWYSENEFEAEFVSILAEQCFRMLNEQWEKSYEKYSNDLILRRTNACLSSTELVANINQMGIATITLTIKDIESILDILIYDGKIEKIIVNSTMMKTNDIPSNLYRSIKPLIESTPIVRNPCGICPVFNDCHDGGLITPSTCIYLTNWIDF